MAIELKAVTLRENFYKVAEKIQCYKFMNNIIKSYTPSILNLHIAKLVYEFPAFIYHYKTLVRAGIIEERDMNHLHWKETTVSINEYFTYIYEEEKKMEIEKDENLNIRIPWRIVEFVFDLRDLKNYRPGDNESKGFGRIKKILNLPTRKDDIFESINKYTPQS